MKIRFSTQSRYIPNFRIKGVDLGVDEGEIPGLGAAVLQGLVVEPCP